MIGCQPENSSVMYKSIQHGSILDIESLETLSDGTAGGVEQNSVCIAPPEVSNALRMSSERYKIIPILSKT